MSARAPEQVDAQFFEAMNRGDLDAAVALHEREARWYQASGEVITGRPAIRAALEAFLVHKPRFSAEVVAMTDGGESIAITRAQWRLEGVGPDGEPLAMAETSLEIVRRQTDGTWLFAVIAPGSD